MKPHEHQARIYFEDTDAGGVVYHANYLRFAERARTEALREAGLPHAAMLAEHGVMFMVRRAQIAYLRPALLDDLLMIRTETLACGGATVALRQSFHARQMLLAEAHIDLACVRAATGTPARIPTPWRALLTPAALTATIQETA